MRTRNSLLLAVTLVFLTAWASGDQNVVIGTNQGGPPHGTNAQNAHLGWARLSPYWRDIETTQGVYNFASADSQVDDAISHGQQVLFILSGVPAWAYGGSNGAMAPFNVNLWTNFVTAVVQHYAARPNRPAAYEIWNEPDLSGSSSWGVGWDRPIDTPPLYVDYFVAAARIIRPTGALAVAPALSGGQNDRTRKLFLQLENTWYADGNASDFVDAISVHQNACCDSTHSQDAASYLYYNKLTYLNAYNPRNKNKPIWITEFGWKSGAIGATSQRTRINNFLIYMTGSTGLLRPWKIDHGFIYHLRPECSISRGIYTCAGSPKEVVTLYLQTLPYPATQQMGFNPFAAQLTSMAEEDETEPAPLPHDSIGLRPRLVQPEAPTPERGRPSPCEQLAVRHAYRPEPHDRDCRAFIEYREEGEEN